ncbi:MAG: hypothetical protein E7099_08255 [Mediterranea massiliensis]|nr:hypothetical protein [Mediterranea massiliensis]
MKNNILIIGAVMLMMASCSNEEIILNEELKNNAEPTLTIIATQGENADSRIAYTSGTNGKAFNLTWTADDVIYVCEAETPDDNFIELTLTAGAGSNRGTFSTSQQLPGSWTDETELIAYYKANGNMYVDRSAYEENGIFFYHTNYTVNQVQTQNGDMNHLKNVNYMKSEKFNLGSTTISNLHFSHQGAIMQFKLTGLEGKTVTGLKLLIDDGTESFTKCYYDYLYGFECDSSAHEYMSSATLFFGENQGNDNYSGIDVGSDEILTAYLMLGATEELQGKMLTLTATTTDGSYIASVIGGEVEDGNFYTIEKSVDIPYVTLKAAAMQRFTLKKTGTYTLDSSFQYSIGGGEWKQLTFETTYISFGGENGDLRLRGKSSKGTSSDVNPNQENYAQITFEYDIPVACSGDIRTLLDWENYTTTSTSNARFRDLFKDCSQLISAPDLPATELASLCYAYMFHGCKSLTIAPILPATSLPTSCYASMFQYCEKLNSVTMLGTDADMFTCMNWLSGVSATGTFYKNSAVTNTSNLDIPSGWTIKNYGE